MIYVIYGEEECFIKDKINEIIKDKDAEIIHFEGSDRSFSIDKMLHACSNYSIFAQTNIVLVNDPDFLIKKVDDNQLELLNNYIKNPSYDSDLILYSYNESFNTRLKAYKNISENAQIIKCDRLDYRNFFNYLKQQVQESGLSLNNECIEILNNLCKRSATLLNNNLQVLQLYPDKINSQVIYRLCTAADENESFELINALVNKDISKAISLERKMMKDSDSILGIISLLSTQLRYLYHVAYLSSSGKRKSEIQSITGSKEYRVTMALKTLENLSKRQIMELLSQLSSLDILCKSDSSISDISRFELFILNLMNRSNHAIN